MGSPGLRAALAAAVAVLLAGGGGARTADRGAVAMAAVGADWPGYHFDAAHTGYAPAVPAATALAAAWRATLDGPVQAAPLVVRGLVIAATENNTVYGLNGATGQVVWSRHLATPVTSGLPCGNIQPLGITGTPVYDPASDRILAVTTSPSARSIRHMLVGLRPVTGALVQSTLIDPVGSDPLVENQRGALNLHERHPAPCRAYGWDCRGRLACAGSCHRQPRRRRRAGLVTRPQCRCPLFTQRAHRRGRWPHRSRQTARCATPALSGRLVLVPTRTGITAISGA